MTSHTLKYQYFIYFQYPTACYTQQYIISRHYLCSRTVKHTAYVFEEI